MFTDGVLVVELAEQASSSIGFSRHTTEDRKLVNENTALSVRFRLKTLEV